MVSTHLKNISQNGNLPQTGMNIKKYLKPPSRIYPLKKTMVGRVTFLLGAKCLFSGEKTGCISCRFRHVDPKTHFFFAPGIEPIGAQSLAHHFPHRHAVARMVETGVENHHEIGWWVELGSSSPIFGLKIKKKNELPLSTMNEICW